jgi:polar amino acid transport system permease protein
VSDPAAALPLGALDFQWSYFSDLVLHPSHSFLVGLWTTVYVSVLAQAIGVGLGLVVELVRRSRRAPLRAVAGFYIWLLRGTPLLVQLVLVYNGLAALGVYRFRDVGLLGLSVPGVIQAGILTLAVNESAYMAEIIRASINSVDRGQMEAAESLGLTRGRAMRFVILPQAVRVMIPPLGNEFNNMMKVTSLLSVIGVEELFLNAQEINSTTFRTFEIFLAAAVYYLALTTIWGFIQSWLERRLAAKSGEAGGPRLRNRLLGSGARVELGAARGAR